MYNPQNLAVTKDGNSKPTIWQQLKAYKEACAKRQAVLKEMEKQIESGEGLED